MHPTQVQNEHADLYGTLPEYVRKTTTYTGNDGRERALVLYQKPFEHNWAIQARVAMASIDEKKADPVRVLAELVRETVGENNFGLTADSVPLIQDAEFGYFLFEWLGVNRLIQKWKETSEVMPAGKSARSSKAKPATHASKRASSKSRS